MKDDDRLDPILKKINNIHFVEESRHIAMGEALIKEFVGRVKEKFGEERLASVGEYLDEYTLHCIRSLYNPAVYRDMGMENPYEVRRQLMADPARQKFDGMLYEQATQYLPRLGLKMFEKSNVAAPKDEKLGRLEDWVKTTCRPKIEITPDTDLIESRVVTSLHLRRMSTRVVSTSAILTESTSPYTASMI